MTFGCVGPGSIAWYLVFGILFFQYSGISFFRYSPFPVSGRVRALARGQPWVASRI